MAEDLATLPLKSMELPTKTTAKLKPLGLTSVADLYAVPLAKLVEVGLVHRELEWGIVTIEGPTARPPRSLLV